MKHLPLLYRLLIISLLVPSSGCTAAAPVVAQAATAGLAVQLLVGVIEVTAPSCDGIPLKNGACIRSIKITNMPEGKDGAW